MDVYDLDSFRTMSLEEWKKTLKKRYRRDARCYLRQFPDATKEEKQALHSWVSSCHSPYDNPDGVTGEDGKPVDFLNALRFLEEVGQQSLDEDGKR